MIVMLCVHWQEGSVSEETHPFIMKVETSSKLKEDVITL